MVKLWSRATIRPSAFSLAQNDDVFSRSGEPEVEEEPRKEPTTKGSKNSLLLVVQVRPISNVNPLCPQRIHECASFFSIHKPEGRSQIPRLFLPLPLFSYTTASKHAFRVLASTTSRSYLVILVSTLLVLAVRSARSVSNNLQSSEHLANREETNDLSGDDTSSCVFLVACISDTGEDVRRLSGGCVEKSLRLSQD